MYTLDDVVSPDYRAILNQMHARSIWNKGQQHIPEFMPWLRELGCTTMLDYGCGKGAMKPEMAKVAPDIDVRLFDPGNPALDTLPEPADFVTACSCIENIEPDRVDKVMAHLYGLAIKGAYFSITIRLGRKNDLPDGRNEHLSVHPPEWWLKKLASVGWIIQKSDYGKKKAVKVWLKKG